MAVPRKRPQSSASAANDTFNCVRPSCKKEPWGYGAKNAVPKSTTAVPRNSSAKSSATDFSMGMLRRKSSLRNCVSVASPSASGASTALWLRLVFKKKLYPYRPDRIGPCIQSFRTRKTDRLALKLARELDRRVASLGLTVEDAIERLGGVRLVRLGEAEGGLWRLADRYPAQQEVLDVLPKLPAPLLSLGKANRNRLKNPRQGRS